MLLDENTFKEILGVSVPPELSSLYGLNEAPIGFRFQHVGFVLEIQYLTNMSKPEYYDIPNGRFTFAVSTDGYDLLVDIKAGSLEILQNEYGDIDSIGLHVEDLLKAETYSL